MAPEGRGRETRWQYLTGLRSGHWPSLVGAWLHFEVSFMTWLLIGALGVPIAEEFALSATQKGLLVACPLLAAHCSRFAVGVISDRFGAKRTGLILLAGVIVAVLWGWLGVSSYGQVLGIGTAPGIRRRQLRRGAAHRQPGLSSRPSGPGMGVAASANSGTVLAMFFAPRLAMVGWHKVFGVMLVPVLMRHTDLL